VGGLLDDAAGSGASHAHDGAHGAALPRGPRRAHAYASGPCGADRPPGAAPSRGAGAGAGAGGRTHRPLAQVGQGHGGVDLAPVLALRLPLAGVPPLVSSEPQKTEK